MKQRLMFIIANYNQKIENDLEQQQQQHTEQVSMIFINFIHKFICVGYTICNYPFSLLYIKIKQNEQSIGKMIKFSNYIHSNKV